MFFLFTFRTEVEILAVKTLENGAFNGENKATVALNIMVYYIILFTLYFYGQFFAFLIFLFLPSFILPLLILLFKK